MLYLPFGVSANDVQVSVLTVRRVYEELEKEGFAVSQAGRGTFVSMGNLELLRDSKRRIIEQDLQKAVHNAKLFDIAKDDLYAMLVFYTRRIKDG